MIYQIAHLLRDRISWLWYIIERVNSWLFSLRYGKRLKECTITNIPSEYEVLEMRKISAYKIVEFFARQPPEAFTYFRPHGFSRKSIERLQKNKSYLAYLLIDKTNGKIVGYCFNRCFFHGVGYRGRMVDVDYRGRGLGTAMNKILNEVGFGIGLRLFETVSKNNVASYKSALSASKVKVVKELSDNELYLEILPE